MTSQATADRADLASLLPRLAPDLRGRLLFDQPLAPITWFRVGGPADALFTPADEADLAYFLARCPREIPVTVIGFGSNLIVRDGGVRGVVVRLAGKGFAEAEALGDGLIRTGAGNADRRLAKFAAENGVDGLAFYVGVPGAIGGALRMNAGAHGGETTDVLVEARAIDRAGRTLTLSHADMGYAYRHSDAPEDAIFVSALYRGRPGERAMIEAEMDRITAAREASQPIREKTGGSTFKNPKPLSAWKVIDAAGCRGLAMGDAQVSEMHCNFLINRGKATAADVEGLGEEVRRRVREQSGVALDWEIKRIGVAG
ncbi:MAG: UDP-N-acetylmuramate dehydrogenase [Hyphomicrobiales bacterium]|nr:UDP-N-acetylmuramate dehydrogenase [Hyphomicrobiales bacterium]MDE2016856.1 UDP-N-acetylmuramate dehydrogenase [Hyphomicrobiales bacterium]